MSDINAETPTPTPADAGSTAGAETAAAPADPTAGALADLQREHANLAAKFKDAQSVIAGLTTERDTLKGSFSELEVKAKEADSLRLQVEEFGRKGRETAIFEVLREKIPQEKSNLLIRGAIMAFHEAGKANRYSEDTKAESAKLLKLIENEIPDLMTSRPATSGGGTHSARVSTPAAPSYKSLVG